MPIHLHLLLAALVSVVPCASDATRSVAPEAASDTTLAARVDAFLAPYVREGLWSGAVIIVRGDSVLHRGGYGLASVEHGAPNTPTTRFGVASVTKAFTALAAARLWRGGVIDRDSPINRWLPDFPNGDKITVAQLVRHRSGIPNTDTLDWYRSGAGVPHTLRELTDSLGAAGLEFEPGTRFKYSNGGYTVLAAVLSAATGLTFPDVLDQWVFRPTGMTASGDLSEGRAVRHLAQGYVIGANGKLVPGPYVHPSGKVGAGSAYTTVEDLVAFFRALLTDRLIPSALRDSLFRPISSPLGVQRIYFGGRGPSYTAAIQIFHDRDVMIAALGNNYGRLNEEITDGLAGLLFGRWEDPRVGEILSRTLPFVGHPLPEAKLNAMAGRYRHQWGFEFDLEREGHGQLVYVFPEHRTRTPMIALSDSTLVSPWQWAELRWEDDGIVWRWLDFPGQVFKVQRLSPVSASVPGR